MQSARPFRASRPRCEPKRQTETLHIEDLNCTFAAKKIYCVESLGNSLKAEALKNPFECVLSLYNPDHCAKDIPNGFEATAPFANAQEATGSKWAVYNFDFSENTSDIGLLFLDTPIHLDSYPEIAKEPAFGSLGFSLGFNHAFARVIKRGPATLLEDGSKYGRPTSYRYNTSEFFLAPGDSGGGVFQIKDGDRLLLAVNSVLTEKGTFLARVDLVADWIAEQIK